MLISIFIWVLHLSRILNHKFHSKNPINLWWRKSGMTKSSSNLNSSLLSDNNKKNPPSEIVIWLPFPGQIFVLPLNRKPTTQNEECKLAPFLKMNKILPLLKCKSLPGYFYQKERFGWRSNGSVSGSLLNSGNRKDEEQSLDTNIFNALNWSLSSSSL